MFMFLDKSDQWYSNYISTKMNLENNLLLEHNLQTDKTGLYHRINSDALERKIVRV